MTPREADKIIKAAVPVSTVYGETFIATFVSRDRRTITDDRGGLYHRDELEVVQ